MSVPELMDLDDVSPIKSNGVEKGENGHGMNGTDKANGVVPPKELSTVSAASGDSEVGVIPHITANIIPLSNILKFYSQESFKQLTTVIENLSVNSATDLDSKRKNQFLQVIISLRHDFLKIYTLVKWASAAKDVSKLIDLLNWFRIQDLYFENLGYGINELNRFLGAKLPNPDLLTSIEVLIQGRPQLPSYNLIPRQPISTKKVLKVLRDLNLVLTTRMALIETAGDSDSTGWLRMLENYEVKDGRIYFTIVNEFQVSISIANDIIVYDHEDKVEYNKSPFYFVDFKFLFGINPESLLITHDVNNKDVVTKLPPQSFANLEKVSNQVLLSLGLEGLYDVLHRYSISFKLYLISRQLRDLALNGKWRGNIQYQYQKSLIIINYWSSHFLSKNWKSFIELGVDKNYNLNFRWFKNGRYIDHGISGVFQTQEREMEGTGSNGEQEDLELSGRNVGDLSVEMILNIIANKHSEGIVQQIHEKLNEMGPVSELDDMGICSIISPHQLLIKLTPTKSTVFAINPLTGHFYFIDPSPIQQQSTRLINNPPPVKTGINANKFVSEDDMINNIINQIFQLRLESFKREINSKLITTEWISNEIIKLNEYEISKLTNFISKNIASDINKIQYYRRKNWPSSWFLLNLISGVNFKSYWWVARIKSIKGEWKIQWVEKIQSRENVREREIRETEREDEKVTSEKEIEVSIRNDGDESVSYQFCSELSTKCSNMIIDHIILEELHSRKIKYIKISKKESILKKFDIREPQDLKIENSEIIYESMIGLYNQNLIPIRNSSTMIILKVQLIHQVVKGSMMRLSMFGKFRKFKIEFSGDPNGSIRIGEDFFEVNDIIPMNQAINSDSSFLAKLFQDLSKLDNLINITNQLNHFNSAEQIRTISLNQIEFTLDKEFGKIKILIEDSGIIITNDSDNQLFKVLITYINRYLTNAKNKSDDASITGVIKYLQQILPPLRYISAMKNKFVEEQKLKPKLNNGVINNGINKINLDISFKSFESILLNFGINSFQPQSKKMLKDKISFKISIKTSKFYEKGEKLLYFVSYKSNFSNSANMKYKNLFETIFKKVNELNNPEIVKLNYDILLINPKYLDVILNIISNCCLNILNNPTS